MEFERTSEMPRVEVLVSVGLLGQLSRKKEEQVARAHGQWPSVWNDRKLELQIANKTHRKKNEKED